MKKNVFNFIDLFAGAGGLSCGLELAGHRCLLGIDMDAHAMRTFALNHQEAESFCGDVRTLSEKEILRLTRNEPIHLVVGGPPCQGFSTVGLGNPKDKRNHLFLEFCRVVNITQPYFIIMENVTGLLAKKNEKTLKAIFKQFTSMGYHLNVQVLSSELYGVAEKRRRTIFIGSRLQENIPFPRPTNGQIDEKKFVPFKTVGEVLANLQAAGGSTHNHDLETAKVATAIDEKRLQCIPEGQCIRYQKDEMAYLPKRLRLAIDWQEMPEGRFRQARYLRLDRSRPSPTILTHRQTYYHPVEHRHLTPREAAAIQSFPNDFIFTGPLSSQWRQIGNAVPPELGRVLGEHLQHLYAAINPQHVLNLGHSGHNQNKKQKKKSGQAVAAKKLISVVKLPPKVSQIRQSAFSYGTKNKKGPAGVSEKLQETPV